MILHTTPSTYIISHPDSIKYTRNDPHLLLNPALFEIHKPFISPRRNQNVGRVASELEVIHEKEVLPYFASSSSPPPHPLILGEKDNSAAVGAAAAFFSEEESTFEKFNGANPTDDVVISEFKGKTYVFPPRSQFHNCDLFTYTFGEGEMGKYDLVVMDPPWQNKFIKRRKGNSMGYETHEIGEMGGLPLSQIMREDGVLAIWSTNSKTEKILGKELVGKWGLHHLTTFYWLKVTTDGRVTSPFTKQGGKQPYETLLILTKSPPNPATSTDESSKLIVSTPSSINSHKPPLTHLLEHYFKRTFTSKCELFARYLLSDYTSYGNQVLKLNNYILFKEQEGSE